MKRTTNDTTTMTDEELATAAGRGDTDAFGELHRRHAPGAWRLALAVSGNPDDAAAAVAEATGRTFTSIRAGRFQAVGHQVALAAAARNAALDVRRTREAIGTPTIPDDADPLLAGAFAALPERWRSVLWLRDVEELPVADTAAAVELSEEAVDQLAVRARRGLRDRYLRAHAAATGDRDCTRAVARLGALVDDTLNPADRATLQGHLDGCTDCTACHARLTSLPAGLAALALPMPDDLRERAGAAWSAALASSTTTGLSPRTEKVLAGVSAFAAALGVAGAAVFGAGAGTDAEPVASPLAPLVSDIETPRVELAALELRPSPPLAGLSNLTRDGAPDLAAATTTTTTAPSSEGGGATPSPTTTAPAPSTGGERTPTTTTPPTTTPPTTTPPTTIADVPVDVNLGSEDTSVTVGPVRVDATPEEGEDVLGLDTPEVLDPVTEPVTDTVNEVLDPVVDAVQPVVEPVTEALDPVTAPVEETLDQVTGGLNDTVNETVGTITGGLGLGR